LGHAIGQACGFIVVVGHHRLFHLDIDLLLSPIGTNGVSLLPTLK
jgi:hypothetical protein